MQKLIYLVITLGLAGASAYFYVKRTAAATAAAQGQSAPKERLDRVRNVAGQIERDAQRRADDLAKKAE
jgi:hypothetical protein